MSWASFWTDPNVSRIPFNFSISNRNPISYAISSNVFFAIPVLYMDNISSPIAIAISLFIGVVVALIVQLFLVPWQRREITGNAQNGRVKFTINDSSESTPSGSPKRKQQQPRPTSLVQTDPKILPAITEQTELASFNNLGGVTPSFYQNDKTAQQNGGAVRQSPQNCFDNQLNNHQFTSDAKHR